MLTGLVNRLRGQVRVRAECAFPERVLNLCGAQDLAFWDLEWESPTAFTCRLSRRDWKRLREAGKNLDCTFDLVGLEGAPYFLLRFRHRQALLMGLVGCALGLFLGSFFIWEFQVEGNETVPTERILRALEKNGVRLGTFGLSLDGEDIRNHVLLDVPELSWIAVNVSGCRAEVQVRERTVPPAMVDRREPCNLVARRAGLVKKVQTIGGVACVVPGSAVTEGQILISGVEDTDTVGARVLAGLGKVEARTWYGLTASMPLMALEKQYTGKEKTGGGGEMALLRGRSHGPDRRRGGEGRRGHPHRPAPGNGGALRRGEIHSLLHTAKGGRAYRHAVGGVPGGDRGNGPYLYGRRNGLRPA